jgi:hypothetical protein
MMGNGENTEERQWNEIKEINGHISLIREHMAEIRGDVKAMSSVFEAHIKDQSIHQRSPCAHLLGLQAKLWGVAILVVSSLVAAIWGLLE